MIAFLFISMLEWLALLLLTCAIYRFPLRDYMMQTGLASLLLSFFSYFLFVFLELGMLATLIQPVIVFLFFWWLFKVPVYYAGLCVVNGYLGYCALHLVILYVYKLIGVKYAPATVLMYSAQALTAISTFVIVKLAVKYRLGFSFVRHGEITKVRLTGTNLKLLLLSVAAYGTLSSINFFLYYLNDYTIVIILLAIVAFGIIQYWTFQKEYESSHWHRTSPKTDKTPDLP